MKEGDKLVNWWRQASAFMHPTYYITGKEMAFLKYLDSARVYPKILLHTKEYLIGEIGVN